MATISTRIIEGELPARFVWKDELSDGLHDMDFDNAARDPDPAKLARTADTTRRELTELGFEEVASWRRSRWRSPL